MLLAVMKGLKVCFCMKELQTNCTKYDYDLHTQLTYLWTWLILIIINDPIGHYYYIHIYILDMT